jgi:O-antigen ligase
VAFAGSVLLLAYGRGRRVAAVAYALPPFLAALWLVVPSGTLERLETIPEQLQGGDLNQRVNIWSAGWEAFIHAPFFGAGAGSFTAAAHLSPFDTAHNTALSIVVGGGLCALFLASLLFALAIRAALQIHGPLRLALVTCLVVWTISSLIATVEENRTTWLLLGIVIVAARLTEMDPLGVAACFRFASPQPTYTPQKSSTRLVEV